MEADGKSRLRTEKLGEEAAAKYLEEHGYRILERNFRTRLREVDIICQKEGTQVFVEVRTKAFKAFGLPEESLTSAKKEHLESAAEACLQELKLQDMHWTIDLVSVEMNGDGRVKEIRHIENVV